MNTSHTDLTSLPSGWTLQIEERAKDLYLVVSGPQKEIAAFGCDRSGVRAEILRRLFAGNRPDEEHVK